LPPSNSAVVVDVVRDYTDEILYNVFRELECPSVAGDPEKGSCINLAFSYMLFTS